MAKVIECLWCGKPFVDVYRKGRGCCSRRCGAEQSARTRRAPMADRFWSKVNKDGPVPSHCKQIGQCWVWTASASKRRNGSGPYGSFAVAKHKIRRAHRVSWEMANGAIPTGLDVLHSCDNPLCVRPDHLFLGTDADNANDRETKGRGVYLYGNMNGSRLHPETRARGDRNGRRRHPERFPVGEDSPGAKFSDETVREVRSLRAEGAGFTDIGRRFGMHRETARRMCAGKIRGAA